MGKSKIIRPVFTASLCLLGLAGMTVPSVPVFAAKNIPASTATSTDDENVVFNTDYSLNLTEEKDLAKDSKKVTYWRFGSTNDNEGQQEINLKTENVPINNSFAGVSDPDKTTIARTDNSSDMNTVWDIGYMKETEHDAGGASHEINNLTTTQKHPYFFTTETGVSYATDAVLTYTIDYDGGNSILVLADDNDKLYYASEKPTTGEQNFSWKLVENKIEVPVTATYTYTRLHTIDDTGVKYQYPDVYQTTEPDKWVSFSNTNVSPNGTSTEDSNSKWFFDYAFKNFKENANSSVVNTTSGTDVYATTDTTWIKNTEFKDDPDTGISGESFKVNNFVYATTETITYTDTLEFYYIDTTYISDSMRDTNIYLKSTSHPEVATEMYSFYQQRNQKLSVKYKKSTGFVVTGLSKNYAAVTWKNKLDTKTDYVGNDYKLLWKTKQMESWRETSINTINDPNSDDSIDISPYEENGTTLYFMDAYNPVSVVKVKIPKRTEQPTLSLNLKNEAYLKGLKPGKYQLRVWIPASAVPASNASSFEVVGNVAYLKLPTDIGTLSEDADEKAELWYDYTGGTDAAKTVLLSDLAKYITGSSTQIPEMYIECRVAGTDKKSPSAIGTTYVQAQKTFVEGMSKNCSIEVSQNTLVISDADSSNQYEYLVGDDTKWKKISKKTTTNAAFTGGAKIKIRKKSITTSDGTLILPSTEVEVTVPTAENATTTYTADTANNTLVATTTPTATP